jgi:hypothetical protein
MQGRTGRQTGRVDQAGRQAGSQLAQAGRAGQIRQDIAGRQAGRQGRADSQSGRAEQAGSKAVISGQAGRTGKIRNRFRQAGDIILAATTRQEGQRW